MVTLTILTDDISMLAMTMKKMTDRDHSGQDIELQIVHVQPGRTEVRLERREVHSPRPWPDQGRRGLELLREEVLQMSVLPLHNNEAPRVSV